MSNASSPIGVFDSGIGGLSILSALRDRLPEEDYVYYADTAYAPYGERDETFIVARTLAVASELVNIHHAKLLVVACNTATAAAIQALRTTYPHLPVVGVEPALKPGIAQSRTGRIAVFATQGTLRSAKFESLLQSFSQTVKVVCQGCPGLASAIESDESESVAALCSEFVHAAGPFGSSSGQADVLVLGCTHYAFAQPLLAKLVGPEVRILETGHPVARQVERLLQTDGLIHPRGEKVKGRVTLVASGPREVLHKAAARWLES